MTTLTTVAVPVTLVTALSDAGFDVPMFDATVTHALLTADDAVDLVLELRIADQHDLADELRDTAERVR